MKLFDIGGIKIGGKPGEYPTVMLGSIFYSGHKIVKDQLEGIFDKILAQDLLDKEKEFSEKTGNPRIVDVVGETTKALVKFIEFVAEYTDSPFTIDSSHPNVRIETLREVAKMGLVDRAVYNSLDEHSTDSELEALGNAGLRNAVVLAFSQRYLYPNQRKMLLNNPDGNGLLDRINRAGVDQCLIDVGVLDIPSIGWSGEVINALKETGYPCGCAPSNAFHSWKGFKGQNIAHTAAKVSMTTLPVAYGANFLFYGPIRNAEWAYPAVAIADAMIAGGARIHKIRPCLDTHPLYRLF